MSLYLHGAVITFKGQFPLDMLRYDFCSPANQIDVTNILDSIVQGYSGTTYTIGLKKYTDSKKPNWTVDRWKSFLSDCTFKETNVYKM